MSLHVICCFAAPNHGVLFPGLFDFNSHTFAWSLVCTGETPSSVLVSASCKNIYSVTGFVFDFRVSVVLFGFIACFPVFWGFGILVWFYGLYWFHTACVPVFWGLFSSGSGFCFCFSGTALFSACFHVFRALFSTWFHVFRGLFIYATIVPRGLPFVRGDPRWCLPGTNVRGQCEWDWAVWLVRRLTSSRQTRLRAMHSTQRTACSKQARLTAPRSARRPASRQATSRAGAWHLNRARASWRNEQGEIRPLPLCHHDRGRSTRGARYQAFAPS